jgi:hypothetical protein
MKDQFVRQAAERGVPAATIDAVFTAFEPFERYGFNKAHATCYGLVAYQTAYLKANYTVEYMTSVLTASRDNGEKVAAAIAECRRLGIEVLPPDIRSSGVEFSVEGSAIRFGLIAVRNVGQGAIESIIAARAEGEFRSLTNFCERIDLRLANKRVVESLARVGALAAFGHPAQILTGLDDAMAAAAATQRDRISGQVSLFDMAADDAAILDAPLPRVTEAPTRERLRWEKELLGLYLSDHPLKEIAEAVGPFVTAYSGDLNDESLDQQRVVVCGIVTGVRTVITKAKASMAIATLEDLQGSIEVVVFPRLYETTRPTWQEGQILLVSGRVDHKAEEVSLLADLVVDWDEALARGPAAFAAEVGAADRGRGRGSNGSGFRGPNGERGGWRPATGERSEQGIHPTPVAPEPIAVGPGREPQPALAVSPLRAAASASRVDDAWAVGELPSIEPAEPFPADSEPVDFQGLGPEIDEPALPDDARQEARAAAAAPTVPVEAGSGQVLHVRFAGGAAAERAMEDLRALIRARPGGTRVILHVPGARGGELPMELRSRVAYDADLLAEVGRRLGRGVELQLG